MTELTYKIYKNASVEHVPADEIHILEDGNDHSYLLLDWQSDAALKARANLRIFLSMETLNQALGYLVQRGCQFSSRVVWPQ